MSFHIPINIEQRFSFLEFSFSVLVYRFLLELLQVKQLFAHCSTCVFKLRHFVCFAFSFTFACPLWDTSNAEEKQYWWFLRTTTLPYSMRIPNAKKRYHEMLVCLRGGDRLLGGRYSCDLCLGWTILNCFGSFRSCVFYTCFFSMQ